MPKDKRVGMLKPRKDIDQLDDDSDDIFQKSQIDRYVNRPDCLENICLAEFAAEFTVHGQTEESLDDHIAADPEVDRRKAERFQLKNRMGSITKRRKSAVIRFYHTKKKNEEDLNSEVC